MVIVDSQGRPIELNAQGFMLHPELWTPEVAALIARETEGVTELTRAHWKVIDYIRGFYLEHQLAPLIRLICKHTGIMLRDIYGLFPSGPAMGAAKCAGLPRPDGCV
jgi:TusE/DsrC/DsvC family sulfur relay protein